MPSDVGGIMMLQRNGKISSMSNKNDKMMDDKIMLQRNAKVSSLSNTNKRYKRRVGQEC